MMTNRVLNFAAGPAAIPEAVLKQAQHELLNWRDTGMSILEVGHRTAVFQDYLAEIQAELRQLLTIPTNYHILFMPGGGQGQFFSVPMNLIGRTGQADYLDTGIWSHKAALQAKPYGQVNIVASNATNPFVMPKTTEWQCAKDAAYFYYCPNETISGLMLYDIPQVAVPLIADMSSCILMKPFTVADYGLIFSVSQKMLGTSGISLVIVREELLGEALPITPDIFNYQKQAKESSCLNSPPIYAIYLMELVVKWTLQQGGLVAMEECNQAKAKLLYDYIDNSQFYYNKIDPVYRSLMNITFTTNDEAKDTAFWQTAAKQGLMGLKGHKLLGGLRASCYNTISIGDVKRLIAFMQDFAQ